MRSSSNDPVFGTWMLCVQYAWHSVHVEQNMHPQKELVLLCLVYFHAQSSHLLGAKFKVVRNADSEIADSLVGP